MAPQSSDGSFELLARSLIESMTVRERRRQIAELGESDLLQLARAIKDLCYSSWSSEPTIAVKAAALLSLLYQTNQLPEIHAILRWVEGIALITKGKLEPAIKCLDDSHDVYKNIGKTLESGRSIVAKLLPLGMLGRYVEAERAGRKALKIFVEQGDQLSAGKVELNLSNIAARRDRHADAIAFCSSALSRFAKLGELSWETMAQNGLANTFAEINDLEGAEVNYLEALKNAEKAGMLVTQAEIEASLGNLGRYQGRYREALKFLDGSRSKFEILKMPHQTAIAELEIADIYAELNLVDESRHYFKILLPTLKRLRLTAEEARARVSYGKILVNSGEFIAGKRQFLTALDIYRREDNLTGVATVLMLLSSLDIELGRLEQADATLSSAESLASKIESPRKILNARLLRARLMARNGLHDEVLELLPKLYKEASDLGDAFSKIVVKSLEGNTALGSGNLVKAKSSFTTAAKLIEGLRDPLPGEEFRRSFFAENVQTFERLIQIGILSKDLNNAFEYAERARARELGRQIENENETGSSNEYSGRIQILRQQLNWIYKQLDDLEASETRELVTRSKRIENELSELRRRSQSNSSQGKKVPPAESSPHRPVLAQIQAALEAERTLIEYVEINGTVGAFVITRGSLTFHADLISSKNIAGLLNDLQFQFNSLRFGQDLPEHFVAVLKVRTDKILESLYMALLKPFIEEIGSRDLVISPAGLLSQIPFHAMFDGSRYLAETHSVVIVPSAAIWSRLSKDKPKITSTVLFGFADEKIPNVEQEIEEVSALLPNARSFTKTSATLDAFERYASKADIIHVACHGQFRSDNPIYSSIHLSDGWVTVGDLVSSRLSASLVTLSACETGLSRHFRGEEFVGFAQSFLSAGAANVLTSLWRVSDEATVRLMVEFYTQLANEMPIREALRTAQLNFIRRNEHPHYWASFVLVGS